MTSSATRARGAQRPASGSPGRLRALLFAADPYAFDCEHNSCFALGSHEFYPLDLKGLDHGISGGTPDFEVIGLKPLERRQRDQGLVRKDFLRPPQKRPCGSDLHGGDHP